MLTELPHYLNAAAHFFYKGVIALLSFASDYEEGAHPAILNRLCDTNLEKSPGYGTDSYCSSAAEKIRAACGAPDAAIYFLGGGTQTNTIVLSAMLQPWQGICSASSGHINVHEAGSIEACGHKILALPSHMGKIHADELESMCGGLFGDENHDHMIMPGAVYISQPTECGTIYSLAELTEIKEVCEKYGLYLYADGARLAYALACPKNDVSLKDMARLCDAFYIGGTKCGALFGEAVVVPDPSLLPHFFTIIKQKGALFAKGRILGLQYDTLFTDDLYLHIGDPAIAAADKIRNALASKGYSFAFDSPTNQIFPILKNEKLEELADKVVLSYWEKYDDTHTVMRIATSWAVNDSDVNELIALF